MHKVLRAGPAPQGCTAKVEVPCGQIPSFLRPGVPNPGPPLDGAANRGVQEWHHSGCSHGTGWQRRVTREGPTGCGCSAEEQQLCVEATVDGNGRLLLRGASRAPREGGCSPWMPELLLRREHPRTRPRLRRRSALPLFVSPWLQERGSCWQRPTPSLPVPQSPGCLGKVELNVWKEQISDETGPFMLSDIKFHAEY